MKTKIPSWLATLLLGGASVAYVMLVFLPGQRAIGKLREEITAQQQEVLASEPLAAELERLSRETEAARQYHQNWRREAPEAERLSAALSLIAARAEETGVTILRLEPGRPQPYDTLAELPAVVACEGSFPALFQFVERLERQPLPLWVETVQLRQQPGERNLVSGEINLRIFTASNDNSE